jgi:hypothetical protein
MTILFGRNTELRVFAGGSQYTIRDLHMDFDILATRDSKPNQAKITVWNLSSTTRNLFSENLQGIEFLASYGTDPPVLLFRGATNNVLHTPGKMEYQTAIFAGEGQKEFTESVFNKSYASGTPVKQILKDLTAALGLPAEIDDETVVQVLETGLSLSGRTKNVLDQVTGDYSLTWSVQHGTTEIIKAGDPPVRDATAIVLSTDTGLLESPVLTDRGVRVKSMLNPAIRPSRLIDVRPRSTVLNYSDTVKNKTPKTDATGIYIVDRAQYIGSNYGGQFDVIAESDTFKRRAA